MIKFSTQLKRCRKIGVAKVENYVIKWSNETKKNRKCVWCSIFNCQCKSSVCRKLRENE